MSTLPSPSSGVKAAPDPPDCRMANRASDEPSKESSPLTNLDDTTLQAQEHETGKIVEDKLSAQDNQVDGSPAEDNEVPISVLPPDEDGSHTVSTIVQSFKHGRAFVPGVTQFLEDYHFLTQGQNISAPVLMKVNGTARNLSPLDMANALSATARSLQDDGTSSFIHQQRERAANGSLIAVSAEDKLLRKAIIKSRIILEISRLLSVEQLQKAWLGSDHSRSDAICFRCLDDETPVIMGPACVMIQCRTDDLNDASDEVYTEMFDDWHRLLNTYRTSPDGVLQIITDENVILLFLVKPTMEKYRAQYEELIGVCSQAREDVAEQSRAGFRVQLGYAEWDDPRGVACLLLAARKHVDRLVSTFASDSSPTWRPILPPAIEQRFHKLSGADQGVADIQKAQFVRAHGNCVSLWALPSFATKLIVKMYDNSQTRRQVQVKLFDLLKDYHAFYRTWHVEQYGEKVKILSYVYKERENWTLQAWIDVLELYRDVFMANDWVHGDIHSHNLLPGLPIDLDLAGLTDQGSAEPVRYPKGYARREWQHRHLDAQAGKPIEHVHDLYSFGCAMVECASQQADDQASKTKVERAGAALADGCTFHLDKAQAAKQLAEAIKALGTITEENNSPTCEERSVGNPPSKEESVQQDDPGKYAPKDVSE